MTNNQIKYMIEVAQTGSVNQAARNLFISQSALSNAIMSVEQEFGRKIFNRSSHGMTLTAFGKLFIAYITPIHQQLTQLYAMRSSSAGGNTPSLSIISNGFYYISDIVAAMGQSHQASGLRISLQEDYGGNVSDVIANGMADLGVVRLWNCYRERNLESFAGAKLIRIVEANFRKRALKSVVLKELLDNLIHALPNIWLSFRENQVIKGRPLADGKFGKRLILVSVRYIFEEQQDKHIILVPCRFHAASQLIASLP